MATKTAIKIHPAANLFPLMSEEDSKSLLEDMREHGVREKLKFFDGMLLDGRNRLKNMLKLSIDPMDYADHLTLDDVPDPVAYVLSLNLHRRQLDTSQRAMVGAKVAKLRSGEHGKAQQICGASTQEEAAEAVNVSTRSITSAKKILDGACLGLKRMAENGHITVSAAEIIVSAIPDLSEQGLLVKQGSEAVKEKAAEIRKENKSASSGHHESNGKDVPPSTPPIEREPGDDTEKPSRAKTGKGKPAAVEPLKVEFVERVKGQTAIDKVKTDLDDADKEIGRFIRAADDLKTAGGMKNHKFVVDNYKIFAKGLAKLREDFTSLNGAWNSSKVEK